MSGKDRFSFYENGVVSINPPLSGDVVGGRATRTTHPKVLRGLESLFSMLLDRQIEIQTPLQWLTKKEVTQKIAEAGGADMRRSSRRSAVARGRKRKAGRRLPCGKRPREETQREAMATVLEARQRHCGVTAARAKDERLGTRLPGVVRFRRCA